MSNKTIYGDITNRMFANALDLLILVWPSMVITDVVMQAFFNVPNQYGATLAKFLPSHPDLQFDAAAQLRYIANYYPEDMVTIIRQFFFKLTVTLVMLGIYIIPFIYKLGATPGKMVVGLKVIDNITGEKISLSQSIIRFLGYIPSVGVFCLGLFSGGWRRDKRTWHDFFADTVVIYSPSRWYVRHAKNLWVRGKELLKRLKKKS